MDRVSQCSPRRMLLGAPTEVPGEMSLGLDLAEHVAWKAGGS